ncbi:MAG: putative glycolipid-binding domain-containing protein, partial [Pseudodonghicola sp.]
RAEQGWLLTGQASWTEAGAEVSLLYGVRCDPDWATLSADITGECGGVPVALRIQSGPEGWRLNDVLQPAVAGCLDLDLSFTPATNLLPLRRLAPEGTAQVRAAWLVPALDRLELLEQRYTPCGAGAVDYASDIFRARLGLHPSGFVTHYPGLWEGWVDD